MLLLHSRRTQGTARRASGKRLLELEQLEGRELLTGGLAILTLPGLQPTLDRAQDLRTLDTDGLTTAAGTITNTPDGGGVDWYQFQLAQAAHVDLTTSGTLSSLVGIYAAVTNDPGFYPDGISRVYDPSGYHLLAQNAGGAALDLAPGTYEIAVSGTGDSYFHPFLAGSGPAGSTGNYLLQAVATDLNLGSGPVVLSTTPAPGTTLAASPLVLRVDLNTAPDASTVIPGETVRLMASADGSFTDGMPDVAFTAYVSTVGSELQVTPSAPLAPGFYRLFLAGNGSLLSGEDFSTTFQVAGNEGSSAAGDDLWSSAHDLGDVTRSGLVQQVGAVGDNAADPVPFDANDVDYYHFQITGAGTYAFAAEVFAGRIGSSLDPALSLFRFDPADQQLHLITANANTQNGTVAEDPGQTLPLYNDAALFAGLVAGDYYLVVSSGFNVPDPALGLTPGATGVFDPNSPAWPSGQLGNSTGPYVLNLLVQPSTPVLPPVAITPADGAALDGSPTRIVIQVAQPLDGQALAQQAYWQTFAQQAQLQNGAPVTNAVFIQGPNGAEYVPQLGSYDPTTGRVTFLLTMGLPIGDYQLHVSGPIVGDAPPANADDFVSRFSVGGPVRGVNGDGLLWQISGEGGITQLGTLFPDELSTGVVVDRNLTGAVNTTDEYQFEVLEGQSYYFALSGSELPTCTLTLLAPNGDVTTVQLEDNQAVLQRYLSAGTYTIRVGDWASPPGNLSYQLSLLMLGQPENPTPLTVGPGPAIRIRPAPLPGTAGTEPTSTVQAPANRLPALTISIPSTVAPAGEPAGGALPVQMLTASVPAPAAGESTGGNSLTGIFGLLATVPVGGTRLEGGLREPLTIDRVVVGQSLDALVTRTAATLTSITSYGGSGDEDLAITNPLAWERLIQNCAEKLRALDREMPSGSGTVHKLIEPLEEIWKRSVDLFFTPASGETGKAVTPQIPESASQTGPEEGSETSPTWAWTGMAAIGAMAVKQGRRRQPKRKGAAR